MKYFVIGDQDTVLGFNLAGVEGKIVSGKEETETAFSEALNVPDVAIVVITEKCAALIREELELSFYEGFPADCRNSRQKRTGSSTAFTKAND